MSFIERCVTAEEIKEAVWSCDPSKAPGYDGFNFAFIREMWGIVGPAFTQEVINFFANTNTHKVINTTWVTLIPKKECAKSISDYRPISMVRSVYKVIAKILSSRLRPLLGNLVGSSQTAYIKGRQILDGALILNETISWLQKSKKAGVILKLDFAKAYDSVSWDFLLEVLRAMGFGRKWRSWIRWCVSTATTSILVNGSPLRPTSMGRGLRQGDPLSPFLFALVAEVLNKMFCKALRQSCIEGIQIGDFGPAITHLQFADDTVVLSSPSEDSLLNIARILRCFHVMSGLKVNFGKSGLLCLGVSEAISVRLAAMLKCSSLQLPFIYLGCPMGESMSRVVAWNPLVKRVQSRLASWRAVGLAKVGRLVLIKAVLNSLPVFLLSLFKIPKTVAKRIEQIQRRFLWAGNHDGRFTPPINWRSVQAPKELGGLGVGCLEIKNSSLLFKWWWRFTQERQSLRCCVISAIHRIPASSYLPIGTSPRITGAWKSITAVSLASPHARLSLWKSMSIVLGDGSAIFFWLHPWFENMSLKDRFRNLFKISRCKRATINQLYLEAGNIVTWDLTWTRPLSLEEIASVVELRQLIQNIRTVQNRLDSIGWGDSHRLKYDTRAQSRDSYLSLFADLNHDLIVNEAWCKLVPPRVQFLLWLVLHGKVHTRDRLARKGILQESQNVCPLCHSDKETASHLFIHCRLSHVLWTVAFEAWGVQLAVPGSPISLLRMWLHTPVRGKLKRKLWKMAFFAIIWVARNGVIFDGGHWSSRAVSFKFKILLGSWIKICNPEFQYAPGEVARVFNHLSFLG